MRIFTEFAYADKRFSNALDLTKPDVVYGCISIDTTLPFALLPGDHAE